MTKKPKCKHERTRHDSLRSWENGCGEMRICQDCGKVIEVKEE